MPFPCRSHCNVVAIPWYFLDCYNLIHNLVSDKVSYGLSLLYTTNRSFLVSSPADKPALIAQTPSGDISHLEVKINAETNRNFYYSTIRYKNERIFD